MASFSALRSNGFLPVVTTGTPPQMLTWGKKDRCKMKEGGKDTGTLFSSMGSREGTLQHVSGWKPYIAIPLVCVFGGLGALNGPTKWFHLRVK